MKRQVLQNDTVFQNKGNKPQAPVEFQLVLYINRVMKAIRNKKLEFIQWPKNNNRAIIHAGFQAIGGFRMLLEQ
ncbi:unnamed protein product [Rhizophagus irregularis]|nr:unnamed protein product [Rhizophagus irregularis]